MKHVLWQHVNLFQIVNVHDSDSFSVMNKIIYSGSWQGHGLGLGLMQGRGVRG